MFSFLFVLFSLHKWKNASGKAAHIWIPQLHTKMSPNSQPVPSPFLKRDTLIPCAFLFISCLSWRQKYWVLVSLSDFKAGRKGQLCENREVTPGKKGGGWAARLLRNLRGLPCPGLPLPPRESWPGLDPNSMPHSTAMWGSPRIHHMRLHFRPRGVTWGRREKEENHPPTHFLPRNLTGNGAQEMRIHFLLP